MTDFVLLKIFLVLRTKLSVLVLTSSSTNEINELQRTRTNNASSLFVLKIPRNALKIRDLHDQEH